MEYRPEGAYFLAASQMRSLAGLNPKFVTGTGEAFDDLVADAGDLRTGERAVRGSYGDAERAALFSVLQLILIEIRNAFGQFARELPDAGFNGRGEFAFGDDDGEVE